MAMGKAMVSLSVNEVQSYSEVFAATRVVVGREFAVMRVVAV